MSVTPNDMRRAGALVAVLAASTLLGPVRAGNALDQEDMSISRAKPTQTKSYGPIAGNNTSLTHKPSDCRSAPYCDVVDLRIDANGFKPDDLYQVEFVVGWENGTANDVDIYIYDASETRIGQAATGDDPEKTVLDLPKTGLYYIVMNNFSGPNTGYTIDLTMEYLGKQKAIPKFERATPRPQFTPLPRATPRPQVPVQELEPKATLAPVLTPGPDGSLTSLGLEAVEAGTRVDEGGAPWWVILISALAAAGVLGGSGYFAFRRVQTRRA